jgi:hypothetical protein
MELNICLFKLAHTEIGFYGEIKPENSFHSENESELWIENKTRIIRKSDCELALHDGRTINTQRCPHTTMRLFFASRGITSGGQVVGVGHVLK